jgi:hypothetical protein
MTPEQAYSLITIIIFLTALALVVNESKKAKKRHEALLNYIYKNLKTLDPNISPPSIRILEPTKKHRKGGGISKEKKLDKIMSGKRIDPYD